jgi:hypothetical protein
MISRLMATRPLLDAWTEFLRQPASRERMAETYTASRRIIGEIVRASIARGRMKECEPETVGAMLTALVEGLLLQAYVDPEFDPLAAWPPAWEIASAGLVA